MRFDFRSILLPVFAVSLLCAGCNDAAPTVDPNDIVLDPGATEEKQEEIKPKEGIPFEVDHEIDVVYGPWLLYVKADSMEVPVGVFSVVPVPGSNPPKFGATIMPAKSVGELEVAEVSIHPVALDVTFTNGAQIQIFEGRLQEGVIYGSMIGGPGICVPARMVRPKEPLSEEQQEHVIEGAYEFTKLLQQGSDWDEVVTFIENHPQSPLIPNAFYALMMQIHPRHVPAEKIEHLFVLIDKYCSLWGDRFTDFVKLNSVLQLANDYRYPELMASIKASFDGKFTEEVWKAPVEYFMENLTKDIELAYLVDSLRQAEEGKRGEILEKLQQEAKAHRFNVKLLVSTAETLEELSDQQAAIEWYLKVVAVPGLGRQYERLFEQFGPELTSPSEKLDDLWKEVHGSPEGLQARLDEEYQNLLAGYEVPEFELPEPNGKQVLIELFTGTACAPCVAADLALSVLQKRLPSDRITLLQYHVHVPAPDPLGFQESQGRYGYYNPKGTPTVLVDGRAIDFASGDASEVSRVIQMLLDEIAEELPVEAPMQIDVNVTPVKEGTASFEASVKADEISDRWRLHVALAEGEVRFQGPNGVPIHEMVVRKLYTSSQGLEPSGGSLKLSGTISPDEIRKQHEQELESIRQREKEYAAAQNRPVYPIPDAPLDLDDLHLVVFVQDVRNRRIRQVVSVPVPSASSVTSVSE